MITCIYLLFFGLLLGSMVFTMFDSLVHLEFGQFFGWLLMITAIVFLLSYPKKRRG